jgi:hypothetical protein
VIYERKYDNRCNEPYSSIHIQECQTGVDEIVYKARKGNSDTVDCNVKRLDKPGIFMPDPFNDVCDDNYIQGSRSTIE